MKKSISDPRLWRRVRQSTQVVFLALFIYLLFEAYQGRVAHPWADLFFRFNPLAALAAMLSSRAWIPRLGLALVTALLAVLLGRVWCGWICPMGTLLEWIPFRRARSMPGFAGWNRLSSGAGRWPTHKILRAAKYVILSLILATALFGNVTLMILDPIAILTRAMTASVLPALNYAITSVERALYPFPFLRPVVDLAESVLRGPVLPLAQYYFAANVAIVMLLVGVVALNALQERFWCRYLCPLGGLLALLSKVALFRRVTGAHGGAAECNHCAQCAGVCPMGTIEPERDYESDPGECVVCLDCLVSCSPGGSDFDWRWKPVWREYDPSRRAVLVALGASAAGVALINTSAQVGDPDPYLVRPPGALDEGFGEDAFLSSCIRCSACIKVCPTGGLQPSGLGEAGLKGLWTPHLVPRLGQCDYGCHACGQVCPSGAIRPLSLPLKQQTVIGRAYIDTNRCLPWADDIRCAVCEEMCPVPDKAIILRANGSDQEGQAASAGGGHRAGHLLGQEASDVPRPYVLSARCIGCGLCEKRCPLNGESAIRVYSPNEPPPPTGYV